MMKSSRKCCAEDSIARVARRVSEGGHGIPEGTLRRRFPLSLEYLDAVYKPLADGWQVYLAGGEVLELLNLGTAMKTLFDHETVLKASRRAAQMAEHGTREEKSGRFLPPVGWKGHLVTGEDAKPKAVKRS